MKYVYNIYPHIHVKKPFTRVPAFSKDLVNFYGV